MTLRSAPPSGSRADASACNRPAPRVRCLGELAPQIVAAEQAAGWLAECEQQQLYLVLTHELIDRLAELVARLPAPRVEVASGRGELAAALRQRRASLLATDVDPPTSSWDVQRCSASDALRHWQPPTVLASFPPIDMGLERLIADCFSVSHFVLLGSPYDEQRLGVLARHTWSVRPLERLREVMITRHDVWLPGAPHQVRQHGRAWLVERPPGSGFSQPGASQSGQTAIPSGRFHPQQVQGSDQRCSASPPNKSSS